MSSNTENQGSGLDTPPLEDSYQPNLMEQDAVVEWLLHNGPMPEHVNKQRDLCARLAAMGLDDD